MWSEYCSEMFTYIGKAPEKTKEEAEETEKMLKRMREELDLQIQRVKMGIKLDGTKYSKEELEKTKCFFGSEFE